MATPWKLMPNGRIKLSQVVGNKFEATTDPDGVILGLDLADDEVHLARVKAGKGHPTQVQFVLPPKSARQLAQRLIDIADRLETRRPKT